ncbi:MAG: ABC transporter ATP-binding protein [Actinobacteria bacterium]|nr:ABC transporter ATP-binding protein [Actinomycetota bacterium]
MSAFLSIENLSKNYGQQIAIKNLSLEIAENEFFALLGPSGCGKTTLLRALAGLESVDAGEIRLQNQDLLSLPANKRPVNLMFQSYALFPHLTVYENVAYGLRREGLPKDEIAERTSKVLRTVSLLDQKNRSPSQLSGGQKQRVALARAIVKRPKILLLDEPLSALDKKVRSEMQLELKRLQHEAGITFILVTHDQEEAMSIADRIALMDQGEVIQVATPVEMYRAPKTKFVADFIGENNLLTGQITTSSFMVAGKSLPIANTQLPSGSNAVLVLRPEQITLGVSGFVAGKLISSNFYGGSTLLFIDCGFDQLIKVTCVLDQVPVVGTTCHLSWNPADATLLSDG